MDPAPMEHSLFYVEPNGYSYVCRYTAGEMVDLFTLAQRQALARGDVIVRNGTHILDMVVLAQATIAAKAAA